MLNQLIEITTGEMLSRIENPEWLVVDIRPIAAYNGWNLRKEKRGGIYKVQLVFLMNGPDTNSNCRNSFLKKG